MTIERLKDGELGKRGHKMTDMEMAEEQIKKWDSFLYPQLYPVAVVKGFIRKAFLAGLKEGREQVQKQN